MVTINRLVLISPIPPSVNHYLGYRGVMRNGKPLASSYKKPDAVKYRSDFSSYVKDEVEKQGYDLPVTKGQHFYVDAQFYFPRVDMDANNYFKVMLDAITDTQLVWADDNVVCERVQGIFYDGANPRVELLIHPVDYIGVFKDAQQLEAYKADNCVGCARYRRNCSLLSNAIAGKIQSDFNKEHCVKRRELKERTK